MKATNILIFFMILSTMLVAGATFQYAFTPQANFHVTQMEILFMDENAVARVDYTVDFFTQGYLFLFGSRNLNPQINELLFDFEEYQIQSIRGTSATVELFNISRPSDSVFLHDKRELGYEVDKLILLYPDGKTLTFNNATETPNTFY
ncbi:MAG: hypothetical protein RBQ94_05575 [Methanimicrococcus sp.]|nr:hypothetical protein [Methanimicrococcus sp.]